MADNLSPFGLRRREVNGRVEIYVRCPNLCHGFGICRWCGNQGGYWRRPKPHYTPFRPPMISTGGCF